MIYTAIMLSIFACNEKETDSATDETSTEEPSEPSATEPETTEPETTEPETTEPSEEPPGLAEGQALIENSCTNSCHAGANMGTYSARFPDDTTLGQVIRGQASGPMQGISAASNWSDDDMGNAILFLRTLE